MRQFLLILAILSFATMGCATGGIKINPEGQEILKQSAGELAGYWVGKSQPTVIDPLIKYAETVVGQDAPADFKEGLEHFIKYVGTKIKDPFAEHYWYKFAALFEIDINPNSAISSERINYIRARLADFCTGLRLAKK